jgi:para-aminobenzoate synthetase component 1
MKILELHEYIEDTANLFNLVADQPWAQYLDSGVSRLFREGLGKKQEKLAEGVDIIVCNPQTILMTYGDETELYGPADYDDGAGRALLDNTHECPFELLKGILLDYEVDETDFSEFDLPFWGGAVGYFGYELARRFEELPENTHDDIGLPDMAIGIYEVAIITCHQRQKSWYLDFTGKNDSLKSFWLDLINNMEVDNPVINIEDSWQAVSDMSSSLSREEYATKFDKVKSYLNDGDCYQINLTNRFDVQVKGDAWSSYLKMRSMSSAPFGAFMNFPFAQVLSNSPEQFIECFDQNVNTSPIKGSRPRDLDVLEYDLALAEELEKSEKDRAENVMIVDLLRSDLGKVCEIGSVTVPELFTVKTYANVHHLVSKISARLNSGFHCLDLLQACFPGGSITGAPKKRAMEIVDELEPCYRGIYCGAIGWIDFKGNMQTNIAIRTIIATNGHAYFSAGGGLVIDSEESDEFEELMNKAKIMLTTVGKNMKE